jgi:uncharacterized protein YqgC (DUF456 family)
MELIFLQNIPWFDILWISIGAVFILLGLIGCIAPVIPGPPLSYFGLLMLQLKEESPFSLNLMLILAAITAIVTIIDYLLPVWGAKKFGAGKWGMWGSVIGLIAGFFILPPLGIFILPFFGALIGELFAGKKGMIALKASLGVFLGFLFGTLAKLIVSGYMFWLFVTNIF